MRTKVWPMLVQQAPPRTVLLHSLANDAKSFLALEKKHAVKNLDMAKLSSISGQRMLSPWFTPIPSRATGPREGFSGVRQDGLLVGQGIPGPGSRRPGHPPRSLRASPAGRRRAKLFARIT
jgi:hypothetical protein